MLLAIIFLLVGSVMAALQEKGDFYLWVNANHTEFADFIFKYATLLGDGVMFAIIGVPILLFSYYKASILTIAGIVQLVVVQTLKRKVFVPNPRPAEYFKELNHLYFVPGVDVHHWNAFPSGHTATAFGLATLLVLFFKPTRFWTVIIFLIALMVGFSRIYLSQHFLSDVVAGAFTGILLSFLVFTVMENVKNHQTTQVRFYSTGLIDLLRKS